MPPKGTVYCYGCLSSDFKTTLPISELLWGKTATGFILFNWMATLTPDDWKVIH